VGAARFLRGLVRVVPAEQIVVIGNTADDLEWNGLHISPDLDTVLYWLGGIADERRGWGIRADTFITHQALRTLGHTQQTWFQVGDRDLATHLYRTARLREGAPLSLVTAELVERMGVKSRIVPMSDQPVTTRIRSADLDLHFQEYFVREQFRPKVEEVYWTGLERARPAPAIEVALAAARAVVIAPSNPIISIGPILRVPGMRPLIMEVRSRTVAISPLIGGHAVKGPTVELMRSQGIEPTSEGVARLYQDIASGFVLHDADAEQVQSIARLGYQVRALPTLLDDPLVAARVAAAALDLVERRVAA
jgi:LPPG:FO 2-phospho-L-lactate transferase